MYLQFTQRMYDTVLHVFTVYSEDVRHGVTYIYSLLRGYTTRCYMYLQFTQRMYDTVLHVFTVYSEDV